MKPTADALLDMDPHLSRHWVTTHLERLEDAYFDRFPPEEVVEHVQRIDLLSPSEPVQILLNTSPNGNALCTVLSFDYPSVFSLITGVLAGTGFAVLSGDIFTYGRTPQRPASRHGRRPPTRRAQSGDISQRRCIIDHFSGHIHGALSPADWGDHLHKRLNEVILLLEGGDEVSRTSAKQRVNEMVTQQLLRARTTEYPVLYPVQIDIDNSGADFTRLRVVSQDTPAFLYSLSNALSFHGLSIEHVRIRTILGRIEDAIDMVDRNGRPVTDPDSIARIKLTILLTKQFTYFLDRAPDPFAALSRFEQLVGQVAGLPDSGKWVETLGDPHAMKDLARVLGTSDFLWEDFIRLQYEEVLPIFQAHMAARRVTDSPETLPQRLERILADADTYERKRETLNAFKDREIFRIDLDHILDPAHRFSELAANLTRLAEWIVRTAAGLVYDHLVARYGHPRTVAGIEVPYGILGLGKLGGAALGYASDIELLFLYSDNGTTDGPEAIGNAEFFGHLARETAAFIESKRDGIFQVDMRLRPYGQSGPMACSLESFTKYYGPGGAARAYERLAFLRMRPVGGDPELGARAERLRDEFLYTAKAIDIDALHELRARQFEEKNRPGRLNAKFSPGALVDLEYSVQILQVMHGGRCPRLRTPRIHDVLAGLREAGILDADEHDRVSDAYDFLRRLINALRMLRGNAKDLFLPPQDSVEFVHLARRMGYTLQGDLRPERQLSVEFAARTAAVRAFVEQQFGRASIPGPATGNIADVVLSDSMPEALASEILSLGGFADPVRATLNLKRMAGQGYQRDLFARLIVLAHDRLRTEPDPDMALNNWERFSCALPSPESHYAHLFSQPRRLDLLLDIFSRSQFLSDTLTQNSEFLDWVTNPDTIRKPRTHEDMLSELKELSLSAVSQSDWLDGLRRFRRRETLRIGTRDMCLRDSIESIMEDISALAEALIQAALERALEMTRHALPGGVDPHLPSSQLCILAFGKLGGRELNYSSDIDLVAVTDENAALTFGSRENAQQYFKPVVEQLSRDLSSHTSEGYAYRTDFRLRPYGSAGDLTPSLPGMVTYYEKHARPWEIQALLKARPIAGHLPLGERFLQGVRHRLLARKDPHAVVKTVCGMRDKAVGPQERGNNQSHDVKTGVGGIRDVEFLVQALQLIYAFNHPQILCGNTLQSLARLAGAHLLSDADARVLRDGYIFLRRVEHYLQIMEDQQIHAVPRDPRELAALARRMQGPQCSMSEFLSVLGQWQTQIRRIYDEHLANHDQ